MLDKNSGCVSKRDSLEPDTILCSRYFAVVTKDYPSNISPSNFNDSICQTLQDTLDGLELKENKKSVDINEIIKKAKKLGYRYSKAAATPTYHCLNYEGNYYDIKLIDMAYRIINDGKNVWIYHNNDKQFNPMVMKNHIGICVIMPYRYEENSNDVVIKI